ncbi:MAG: anhydro-N-acetylmuramic acid kinase [Bacteroidota bacterium]
MSRTLVIGLMSGTSLDGIDLAFCDFNKSDTSWSFNLLKAETIPYSPIWKDRLLNLIHTDGLNYVSTHVALGRMYGTLINEFIAKHNLNPELIASHGHTIFHQPEKGFTAQIGDGSQIAALTGIDTVCDFRSKDLALGGQGAPLVPAGEQLLFRDYRFCLNLGGIANITFNDTALPVAFDVCIANMALNEIAARSGKAYDENGNIASAGKIIPELLIQLNEIEYHKKPFPKSIGREWYEKNILTLLNGNIYSDADLLLTLCEHIGQQIGNALRLFPFTPKDKLLVTGGGAFNKTLINCIHNHIPIELVIPNDGIISYKEAIVFAFLGLLNIRGENNVLAPVTGSSRSHTGGALYKGN